MPRHYRFPFRTAEGKAVTPETGDGASYGFYLPDGTQILASRSGRVVDAQYSETLPPNLDILHQTNYVVVRHSDDTYARYVHVRPMAQIGARVKTGDLIGELYGYSEEMPPHLHFDSYRLDGHGRKLPIKIEFR